jgi:hypothetical protein
MSPTLLVFLLASLLISMFVIIPKYADPRQEAIIQDWVGLGFNGLLFLIVLYETRLRYMNVYYAIAFFLVALAVAVSGVYWWIPTYIKKDKQQDAIKTMFTSLSVAVLLTNIFTSAVPIGVYNDGSMGGRRR